MKNILAIIAILALTLAGCGGSHPAPAKQLPPPPDLKPIKADATQLAKDDTALQSSWGKLGDAINAPASASQPVSQFVETNRTTLQATDYAASAVHDDTTRLSVDLGVVDKQTTAYIASAKSIQKDNVKLTAAQTDDPAQDRIRNIGLILGGLGLLALIAGLAVPVLRAIPVVWEAGAAAMAFGSLLLLVARYLHTLEWIAGGIVVAALIVGALWYVKHYGIPSWVTFWKKTPTTVPPITPAS